MNSPTSGGMTTWSICCSRWWRRRCCITRACGGYRTACASSANTVATTWPCASPSDLRDGPVARGGVNRARRRAGGVWLALLPIVVVAAAAAPMAGAPPVVVATPLGQTALALNVSVPPPQSLPGASTSIFFVGRGVSLALTPAPPIVISPGQRRPSRARGGVGSLAPTSFRRSNCRLNRRPSLNKSPPLRPVAFTGSGQATCCGFGFLASRLRTSKV